MQKVIREYTTGDVARERGISRAWVYKTARDRNIGRRIGRMIVFNLAEYRKIMAIPLGEPGRPITATSAAG